MLTEQKKIFYKTITFRINVELIDEFREICKKYDKKQVLIIENAMKKAIEELKGVSDEK